MKATKKTIKGAQPEASLNAWLIAESKSVAAFSQSILLLLGRQGEINLILGTIHPYNWPEVTLSAFLNFALSLPETEESLYYGKPAVKRAGKIMFSFGEEEVISVKLDWDSKLRLLEDRPEVFSVTPHLSTWPWVLVKLTELKDGQGEELARLSWQDAPQKAVIRKGCRITH